MLTILLNHVIYSSDFVRPRLIKVRYLLPGIKYPIQFR